MINKLGKNLISLGALAFLIWVIVEVVAQR